jgi:hypothetical protein
MKNIILLIVGLSSFSTSAQTTQSSCSPDEYWTCTLTYSSNGQTGTFPENGFSRSLALNAIANRCAIINDITWQNACLDALNSGKAVCTQL